MEGETAKVACVSNGDNKGCSWTLEKVQKNDTYFQYKIRHSLAHTLLREDHTPTYANSRGDRALELSPEDTTRESEDTSSLWSILVQWEPGETPAIS